VYTLSGFRVPEFTQTELRQLEAVHVDVPEVSIFAFGSEKGIL
jgi:hypothetical protein